MSACPIQRDARRPAALYRLSRSTTKAAHIEEPARPQHLKRHQASVAVGCGLATASNESGYPRAAGFESSRDRLGLRRPTYGSVTVGFCRKKTHPRGNYCQEINWISWLKIGKYLRARQHWDPPDCLRAGLPSNRRAHPSRYFWRCRFRRSCRGGQPAYHDARPVNLPYAKIPGGAV